MTSAREAVNAAVARHAIGPDDEVPGLDEVFEVLRGVYEPGIAAEWLLGRNDFLNDAVPLDVLRRGDRDDVMAAARAAVQRAWG